MEGQRRFAAFLQALQEVGWEVGRNVRVDIRWARDVEFNSKYAMELLTKASDIMPGRRSPSTCSVSRMARSLSIGADKSRRPLRICRAERKWMVLRISSIVEKRKPIGRWCGHTGKQSW